MAFGLIKVIILYRLLIARKLISNSNWIISESCTFNYSGSCPFVLISVRKHNAKMWVQPVCLMMSNVYIHCLCLCLLSIFFQRFVLLPFTVRQLKKYCLISCCHTIMHISEPLPVSSLIIDITWVNNTIAQVTLERLSSAKQLEGVHVTVWCLIGNCPGLPHHFCFFNSNGIPFRQSAP